MDLASWAVVVPSNRHVLASRLAAIPTEVPIFVVEDGDDPVRVERPNVETFSKDFQRRYMGSNYDLIPRGTAACRNFGFYYLWRERSVQRIISIDDDVVPPVDFLQHYARLGERLTIEVAATTDWINTIALFEDAPPCYARGYPFHARLPSSISWTTTTARIVAHMGLWDGVLDTHAIDKQLLPEYQREYRGLRLSRPIVGATGGGHNGRFPLSSMNFGFVLDALPAMYQAPMRASFIDRYTLWRYDDIWAGYLFQTLAALRGDACTFGAPVVAHDKAGNLYRELMGEHYGVLLSPYLYAAVDHAARDVTPSSYVGMYADLMDRILTTEPEWRRQFHVPGAFAAFITEMASTMLRWAGLCARCSTGSRV